MLSSELIRLCENIASLKAKVDYIIILLFVIEEDALVRLALRILKGRYLILGHVEH